MNREMHNSNVYTGSDKREDDPSILDMELQRLESGYSQAKAQLSALERKRAGEIEKYGEEHFLQNSAWHKEHYEAAEAVRSAKYWLDAHISEMRGDAMPEN